MLPPNHERALHEMLDVLERLSIPYRLTGGVAGNLYGSSWPPHDIDIDVPRDALPRLTAALGDSVIAPVSRCVDEEFDVIVLKAMLDGVLIELVQVEESYHCVGGVWRASGGDLSCRQSLTWLGRAIWVQPLEEIIAYKRRLGRRADVSDLEQFLAR